MKRVSRRGFFAQAAATIAAALYAIREMRIVKAGPSYTSTCYAYWKVEASYCSYNQRYVRERLCCWWPGSYCTNQTRVYHYFDGSCANPY